LGVSVVDTLAIVVHLFNQQVAPQVQQKHAGKQHETCHKPKDETQSPVLCSEVSKHKQLQSVEANEDGNKPGPDLLWTSLTVGVVIPKRRANEDECCNQGNDVQTRLSVYGRLTLSCKAFS
jgi:hypothetical protein